MDRRRVKSTGASTAESLGGENDGARTTKKLFEGEYLRSGKLRIHPDDIHKIIGIREVDEIDGEVFISVVEILAALHRDTATPEGPENICVIRVQGLYNVIANYRYPILLEELVKLKQQLELKIGAARISKIACDFNIELASVYPEHKDALSSGVVVSIVAISNGLPPPSQMPEAAPAKDPVEPPSKKRKRSSSFMESLPLVGSWFSSPTTPSSSTDAQ